MTNYRFKMAVLPLLHDNMEGRTERFYEQAKRCGVKEMRVWPQRSDWITDGTLHTDPVLRSRFREHLRRCKKYNITPDITVCYERVNPDWFHSDRIPHLRAIGTDCNAIIGKGKWKLSLNEGYTAIAPKGFGVSCDRDYYPNNGRGGALRDWHYHEIDSLAWRGLNVHENMPKVRRHAAYVDWIYLFMNSWFGLPLESLIVDVQVHPDFPAHMNTRDAVMAGGLGGEWFGRDDTKRVVGAFHGIVLAEDLWHEERCGGHLREARRILTLELSNDGGSTGNPTGDAVIVDKKPTYTDASEKEFKAKNALIWKLAKKGVPIQTGVSPENFFRSTKRMPVSVTNEWLPREIFVHCFGGRENTRNWELDLNAIDWKRLMRTHPAEYINEHNLLGPLPEEQVDPDPDPEPEPQPDPQPEPTPEPQSFWTKIWNAIKNFFINLFSEG